MSPEPILPAYVERGGELVYRVPYQARDALQYLFLLRADADRLAETFARDFGRPSGGAVPVRPALGLVILAVSRIAAIQSAEPPDSLLGAGIGELEVAFLTVGVDERRNVPVVCVPYLWVDSGMAVAAGRELFGLPKQHGVVTITGGDRPDRVAPERITVDALSIERFDPRVPYTPHRVIDIAPLGPGPEAPPPWRTFAEAVQGLTGALIDGWRAAAPPAPSGRGGLRGLISSLVDAVDDLADEARVLMATVGDFVTGTFPIIGLKQFRDIRTPDRACYQAITEAPMRLTGFHGGGLLGAHTVSLGDLASEPIRADLGLGAGPLRPLVSGWLRYDFRLEAGVELWNASRPADGRG